MRHWFLLFLLAVTVAVIAYLAVWIFTGNDRGLDPEEPDGRAVPLPGDRPLVESDISSARFDPVARGYRMMQVDAALRRAAYDIGYKQELIDVLEAEVVALRDGRGEDADALRQARESALGGSATSVTLGRVTSAEGPEASGDADSSGDGAGSPTDRDDLHEAAGLGRTYVADDEGEANRAGEAGDAHDTTISERASSGR
ncbi:MAG TPA: DivIVA domain-containing protein [Micromonosporaceae bacterium]